MFRLNKTTVFPLCVDKETSMLRYFSIYALFMVMMVAAACTPPTNQGGTVPQPTAPAEDAEEDAATAEGEAEATEESTEEPEEEAFESEGFMMRDLGVELSNPLAIVYGPDDYLWVTERTGKRVVRVNPADGALHVAL